MRRFKPRTKVWLTGFFYAVAIAGSITAMVMLFRIVTKIDQTNTQIKRQSNKIEAQGKKTYQDLQKATDTLERDLECVGTFFGLPDRVNLRIVNLRECTIVNEQTGEIRVIPVTFVAPPSMPIAIYTVPQPSEELQTPSDVPPPSPDYPEDPPEANPPVAQPPTAFIAELIDGTLKIINDQVTSIKGEY